MRIGFTGMRKFASWIKDKARSTTYAVLVTVLLALVGLLGSLFTNEIRSAFPFYWGWLLSDDHRPFFSRFGWSWLATGFWLLLLFVAWVFGVRQLATDEDQRKLQSAVEKLERVVRTVPSPDFLAAFKGTFILCNTAAQAVLEVDNASVTRDEIHQALHHILGSIALLAWKYDGQPQGVEYGANIMLFRPVEAIAPGEWEELRQRMPFDVTLDATDVVGVLDLQIELSATQGGGPDPSLQPLAIAIPRRHESRAQIDGCPRWRVLPGAPLAFSCRRASHYADTTQLGRWLDANGDFSREVRQVVVQYFTSRDVPLVGSFLSVPIGVGEETPRGVLNVHRSTAGLLKETESALQQFVPLLHPILLLVVRLLDRLE
jgi:hypothetical protein